MGAVSKKALTFSDSFTVNQILQCETPLECKKLSYNVNGVDRGKWMSVRYELCFDGIREKFLQNPPLLAMLTNNITQYISRGNDRLPMGHRNLTARYMCTGH